MRTSLRRRRSRTLTGRAAGGRWWSRRWIWCVTRRAILLRDRRKRARRQARSGDRMTPSPNNSRRRGFAGGCRATLAGRRGGVRAPRVPSVACHRVCRAISPTSRSSTTRSSRSIARRSTRQRRQSWGRPPPRPLSLALRRRGRRREVVVGCCKASTTNCWKKPRRLRSWRTTTSLSSLICSIRPRRSSRSCKPSASIGKKRRSDERQRGNRLNGEAPLNLRESTQPRSKGQRKDRPERVQKGVVCRSRESQWQLQEARKTKTTTSSEASEHDNDSMYS
mmetsp:Transcript_15788/g.38119  ORF Transcript_15788/g.38119 Transcript_15788/m.38119 type:complete len:279 (+) Transcript_15788:64-900(+)